MQPPWVLSHLKSSHQTDKVRDLETSLLIQGKNQRVGTCTCRRWVGTIAHWTTGLACIGLDSPKLPHNALFSATQVGESSSPVKFSKSSDCTHPVDIGYSSGIA